MTSAFGNTEVECWRFSSVSENTAVVIFRVSAFGEVTEDFIYSCDSGRWVGGGGLSIARVPSLHDRLLLDSTPLIYSPNHAPTSHSPPTPMYVQDLPKCLKDSNSKNGNCRVRWNIEKPSTLNAEYSRKPNPNISEYVSMVNVCNQICTDPGQLKSNVRLSRTSIKMTKRHWRLCEIGTPIANLENFRSQIGSSAILLIYLFSFGLLQSAVVHNSNFVQHKGHEPYCLHETEWGAYLTVNMQNCKPSWIMYYVSVCNTVKLHFLNNWVKLAFSKQNMHTDSMVI
jgi:hypothetical protein